jgi:trehalose 6-phosphate phosphatase
MNDRYDAGSTAIAPSRAGVGLYAPTISDIGAYAIFLDLDGTLADLAATPGEVRVEPEFLDALARLSSASKGALAIVSGRDLGDIDALLAPHVFPAAGVHGARRRLSNGRVDERGLSSDLVDSLAQRFKRELGGESGLFAERKSAAFAVHYRARPDLQDVCRTFMHNWSNELGGFVVLPGKAVFEAVSRETSKGGAIRSFMQEAPFAERRALFAGDDVTDESGFDAVNEAGGVSIKIGDGPTSAKFRMSDGRAFRSWLMAQTMAPRGASAP